MSSRKNCLHPISDITVSHKNAPSPIGVTPTVGAFFLLQYANQNGKPSSRYATQAVKQKRHQHPRKRKEEHLIPMCKTRAQRTSPSTLSHSRSKQGPETSTVKEDLGKYRVSSSSARQRMPRTALTEPSPGCDYKRRVSMLSGGRLVIKSCGCAVQEWRAQDVKTLLQGLPGDFGGATPRKLDVKIERIGSEALLE